MAQTLVNVLTVTNLAGGATITNSALGARNVKTQQTLNGGLGAV